MDLIDYQNIRVVYITHMETWKQFDANVLTHSATHHLFAIHELGSRYGGWARVSDIARFLGITRGSVSISLRTLKQKGLVVTDQNHMVHLSEQGEEIVKNISAKRVATQTFLHEVLGMSAEQAEVDSCKIEHLISPQMAQRLVHFMKFLTSEKLNKNNVLRAFRKYEGDCPGDGHCSICKGQCLLSQLNTTS